MPFPTTPLLDAFNRSALGSNWADAWGDGSALVITANQLGGSNAGYSGSYWTPRTFFNVETYLTLAVAPVGAEEIWLNTRARNSGGGSGSPPTGGQDTYWLRLVATDWAFGRVYEGNVTNFTSGGALNVPTAGDRWGYQFIGSTYTIWRMIGTTGVWTQLATGSETDPTRTLQYGYSGLEILGTTARIDDYSGGTPPVGSDTNKEWGGRGASW